MPYWEWVGLSGMDEGRKYLQGKLQCNVGVDSAAHSRQAPGIKQNRSFSVQIDFFPYTLASEGMFDMSAFADLNKAPCV